MRGVFALALCLLCCLCPLVAAGAAEAPQAPVVPEAAKVPPSVAGGAPPSLPGREVTPEEMRRAFPQPLGRGAAHLPLQALPPLGQRGNEPAPLPLTPVQGGRSLPGAGQGVSPSLPLTPSQSMGNAGSGAQQAPRDSRAQGGQPPALVLTPGRQGVSMSDGAILQSAPHLSPAQGASLPGMSPSEAPAPVRPPSGASPSATLPGRPQKGAWPPAQPTLACMVGQMLMVGFSGTSPEHLRPLLQAVRQGLVGGVVVQPGNVLSPPQVRTLTALLQQAAREGNGIPLFIAVAQEGGLAQTLTPRQGFEGGTAAQRLGQGTPEQTHAAARRMGLELAALGVNLNFAPVAAVNFNPLSPEIGRKFRSFGNDPQRVAAHALAFGRGLAAVGVIPCLKYFPGLGSQFAPFQGRDDALPDVSGVWRQEELVPYMVAFQQGWRGAVMPALACHRGLDALNPLTVSRAALEGLLRRRLGFQGLVISNDLQALGAHFPPQEALARAVEAGVDVCCFPQATGGGQVYDQPRNPLEALGIPNGFNPLDLLKDNTDTPTPESALPAAVPDLAPTGLPAAAQGEALSPAALHGMLLGLVGQGRLSEQRIRASWQRIIFLKQTFLGGAVPQDAPGTRPIPPASGEKAPVEGTP